MQSYARELPMLAVSAESRSCNAARRVSRDAGVRKDSFDLRHDRWATNYIVTGIGRRLSETAVYGGIRKFLRDMPWALKRSRPLA